MKTPRLPLIQTSGFQLKKTDVSEPFLRFFPTSTSFLTAKRDGRIWEANRQDCRETSTAPADSASRRFPWPSTCDSHDRLPPAKTHQPTVKNGHVKSAHFSARFQEKGSDQGPALFSSDEEEKEKDAGTTAYPTPFSLLSYSSYFSGLSRGNFLGFHTLTETVKVLSLLPS